MAGPVVSCATDPIRAVLCKIFCQTKREGAEFKANPANAGKRFDYSRRAKELAETSYKKSLQALGHFVPEKSFLVSLAKSSLGKTARKVYTEAALKRRLQKEAMKKFGEKAAEKAAKKAVTSVALKFVPFINVLSLGYDIYDFGSMGIEAYESIDDYLKNYDTFQIRPDIAELGPDGEVKKIYDYKFDYPNGSSDSMGDEQKLLYRKKTNATPVEINAELCGC